MHFESTANIPGRICPSRYGYSAEALNTPEAFQVDTLYVAGGLYGNLEALDALERLARYDIRKGQRVAIVFNGDFHWFDAKPEWFMEVNERIWQWTPIAGNVELEIADPFAGTGCGCAYPDHVGDDMVRRSNSIMRCLQTATKKMNKIALKRLPRALKVQVGSARVLCVHGDTNSVSGWRFAAESLGPSNSPIRRRLDVSTPITSLASLYADFRDCAVDVIASSHTCLPIYCQLAVDGTKRILANNGSSGMPNFDGTFCGIATRISCALCPPVSALFGIATDNLRCDAIMLDYDQARWLDRFLKVWPEGSSAYTSYFTRLNGLVGYSPDEAIRDFGPEREFK